MGSWSSSRDASAALRMTSSGDVPPRQNGSPKRQLVLGQGAGLVRAQHVHARQLLDRREPADHRLFRRQQPGAHGHGHREHRGHGHRHRGDREDERELQGLEKRIAPKQRHAEDQQDQPTREEDQVVPDLEHRLLKVADGAASWTSCAVLPKYVLAPVA